MFCTIPPRGEVHCSILGGNLQYFCTIRPGEEVHCPVLGWICKCFVRFIPRKYMFSLGGRFETVLLDVSRFKNVLRTVSSTNRTPAV